MRVASLASSTPFRAAHRKRYGCLCPRAAHRGITALHIGEIKTKPGTWVKPGRAIIFKTALNFPTSLQQHIVKMCIVSSTKDDRLIIVHSKVISSCVFFKTLI